MPIVRDLYTTDDEMPDVRSDTNASDNDEDDKYIQQLATRTSPEVDGMIRRGVQHEMADSAAEDDKEVETEPTWHKELDPSKTITYGGQLSSESEADEIDDMAEDAPPRPVTPPPPPPPPPPPRRSARKHNANKRHCRYNRKVLPNSDADANSDSDSN